MRLLIFLFLLSVVVAAHELGHFAAMRLVGVEVEEVSVGFGPKMTDFEDSHGTKYTLRLLPLGGFTRPVEGDRPGSMSQAGTWSLALIDVGGMLATAILAFWLFWCVFVAVGAAPEVIARRLTRLPPILRLPAAAFLSSFGVWFYLPWYVLHGIVTRRMAFFAELSGPIGMLIPGRRPGPPQNSPFGTEEELRGDPPLVGLFRIVAILAVGLAGFNLLPLLPLDGGQLGCLVAAQFGKTVLIAYAYGSMAIFGLFVLAIMISDIRFAFWKRR